MKNINNKIIFIFAAALAVGLFFSLRPAVSFAQTTAGVCAQHQNSQNGLFPCAYGCDDTTGRCLPSPGSNNGTDYTSCVAAGKSTTDCCGQWPSTCPASVANSLNEPPTPNGTPGSGGSTTCVNGKYMGTPANCGSTLQQGSRCDQVCVLQQNLDNMSLYTSSANGGNPDGEYGPDTTAAVKQYQLEYNAEPGHSNTLRTDGVADPATQQAIASDPILGGGSGSPPAPAGSGVQPGSGSPPAPAASSGDCASMGLDSVNGICVPKSGFSSGSIAGATNLVSLVLLVLKYLLILSGLIATVALVVGGFWYITAAGNEEQAEKGRKALLNAIIGMVIIIMAYAIVNILTATLTTTDITKTT